ncbi:hypothetical protein CJF30_00008623 [Rutstroemia sp. NJR-2017a BBW]|nr:hypothetical protein CJF30_00008623 [Rutstroemia sp. NJR-2017a BBW]
MSAQTLTAEDSKLVLGILKQLDMSQFTIDYVQLAEHLGLAGGAGKGEGKGKGTPKGKKTAGGGKKRKVAEETQSDGEEEQQQQQVGGGGKRRKVAGVKKNTEEEMKVKGEENLDEYWGEVPDDQFYDQDQGQDQDVY